MALGGPIPDKSFPVLVYNMERADEFVNSDELTYTDRLDKPRKTIAGITKDANDLLNTFRALYLGAYSLPNKQFTQPGQFVVWQIGDGGDGNAYIYTGESFPYSTDIATYPDPNNDPNLQVDPNVTALYVQQQDTKAQEELLPPGSQIFPEIGTLENGQTVTAGTTHLRVEIDGEPTIVAMSPIASGLVADLTDTGATIGGTLVKFLPVSKLRYYTNSSGSAVDNMIADFSSTPSQYSVGVLISTGNTTWMYNNQVPPITIDNFTPVTEISLNDFLSVGDDATAALNMIASTIRSQGIEKSSMVASYGDFSISGAIDLSGINADFELSLFTFTDEIQVSPVVTLNRNGGGITENRNIVMRIDGNRDNQTSTITDFFGDNTTERIAFDLHQQNCIGGKVDLKVYNGQTGLIVNGNTELQKIKISGYNTKRLIQESVTDANTPDENEYDITGDGCDQLFIQTEENQLTSCTININSEQCGTETDNSVLIKTNKYAKISGICRSVAGEFINIDSGASSTVKLDLELFSCTSVDKDAFKITDCGIIEGAVTINSTVYGGMKIDNTTHGGKLFYSLISGGAGDACTIGVDTSVRANNLDLTISNAQPSASQTDDINIVRAHDSQIKLIKGSKGLNLTGQDKCYIELPREYITSDLPIVTTDINVRWRVNGSFTTSEILAYSTPKRGMKTYNRSISSDVFFTTAWQVPSTTALV